MNTLDNATLTRLFIVIGIVAVVALAIAIYTLRSRPKPKPPLVTVELLPESYLVYNGRLLVDAAAFVEVKNCSENRVKLDSFSLRIGRRITPMVKTRGQNLPLYLAPGEKQFLKFRKRGFCDAWKDTYVHTTRVIGFFDGTASKTYSSAKRNVQVYREK